MQSTSAASTYNLQQYNRSGEIIIMFHTHSSAEFTIPSGLATPGIQSWQWVELPLLMPYFCVSINTGGDEDLRKQFIVAHIEDVLRLLDAPPVNVTGNPEVGLMSPGYMNGTDFYQMSRLKEIWESADGCKNKYVMDDGKTLYYPAMRVGAEQEFELILSL